MSQQIRLATPMPRGSNVAESGRPVWDALTAAVSTYADKPAVVMGDDVWTYDQLFHTADEMRRWLQREVPEGPILYVPRNKPRSVAFLLGAMASGTIPLFADPAWKGEELSQTINRLSVRALAYDGSAPAGLSCVAEPVEQLGITLAPVVVDASEQEPIRLRKDTAFGRFTSGTTGFARCLQFSSEAPLAAAESWRQAAELTAEDRILCLATLNNGLAFNTSILAVLLTGGTLVFHPGRLLTSSLARTLNAVQPTVLVAFPFAYELLTGKDRQVAPPTLRLAVSSAAPLPAQARELWREETGLAICDYYGLAEVGPCTFNDGSVPDSVGVPLPGVSFVITGDDGQALPQGTVGRIRVKSRSMALDYLDTAEPTFAENIDSEGYYVTRDIGFLDPKGNIVLRGRVGRVINIAGRKIDPTEVEQVLRDMPGVQHALVRAEETEGRPFLAAYVESRTVHRNDIVIHCLSRMAQYKIPQKITIAPELPRSSAGKISLGRLDKIHEGASS